MQCVLSKAKGKSDDKVVNKEKKASDLVTIQ